jgi:putative ABC transport system permease protein
MPDGSRDDATRGDWRAAIESHLAALGVPAVRCLEIIEEVAQHLQDRFDELQLAGHESADARRLALNDLESGRLVRELARIEHRSSLDPPALGRPRRSLMSGLVQDIRYALRTLRQAPLFSAIVIGTLAIGIGANTAIFTVTDVVMLRPYSYPEMDRIVAIMETQRAGSRMSVAWPTFQDWVAQTQAFEHLGIYRTAVVNLTGGDQPERLNSSVTSSGVFAVMGIPPLTGRSFQPEDDGPGAARVAVISERLWRNRLNADPSIVGRSITLNGDPHTIVGVMPRGMRFPSRLTDVWLPLGPIVKTLPNSRGAHPGLFAIGKLKSGVTFDRAVADMDTIARRLETQYPESNKNVAVAMTPYYEQIVQNIRPTLLLLLGAVGFVLLIGCANLANLMLARAERRQREIAVRAALGAERRRIVQQLLTESILMSLVGGALGVLIAWWAVKAFVASEPTTVPRIDLISVDLRVLAFAAGLSVVTGILFGLVPAIRGSSADLITALKQSARGSLLSPARGFRSALIVAEVALALVLLVGAGLAIRSFARLMAIDPGFDPENVITMRVTLPVSRYPDAAKWLAFHDALILRVAAIPGVSVAGLNSAVPLEGGGSEAPVIAEGQPLPSADRPATMTLFQASSPDYLKAMGVPLLKGRLFTDRDKAGATPVVIVDDLLVSKLFPDTDPIGKRICFEFRGTREKPDPIWREVVGVVRHVRHYGLASEPPFVQLYAPMDQLPYWFEQRRPSMALALRTTLAPEAVTGSIRRELASIDRDIPVYGVQTMKTYLAQNVEQPRLSVVLLSSLGGLALLLALMGIYGVVSYSVAQRTQEIGVRMALGATRHNVFRLIISHTMTLIAIGIALGLTGALALGSLMRTLLFEVSARDPWTFVAIAATLATVGLIASFVPARRATRVDQLVALRAE